jgi:hypothetical protein
LQILLGEQNAKSKDEENKGSPQKGKGAVVFRAHLGARLTLLVLGQCFTHGKGEKDQEETGANIRFGPNRLVFSHRRLSGVIEPYLLVS